MHVCYASLRDQAGKIGNSDTWDGGIRGDLPKDFDSPRQPGIFQACRSAHPSLGRARALLLLEKQCRALNSGYVLSTPTIGPTTRVRSGRSQDGCAGLIRKDRDCTPNLLQILDKKYWREGGKTWWMDSEGACSKRPDHKVG